MAKPPSRELLVMRHGKSDRDVPVGRDFDRPLAGRGRRDAKRMGRWMEERGLRPDLVVASPAARAIGTAERLGFGTGSLRLEPRLYDASLARILLLLGEVPTAARRVLLVGHNPGLEELVLHLGGNPSDGKLLPTAAVARFAMPEDWGRLPQGAGRLREITRPRDLA